MLSLKTAAITSSIFLSACQLSTHEPTSGQGFKEAKSPSANQTTTFLDESGKSISFEQFSSLVNSGRKFSVINNSNASGAVIRIDKAEHEKLASFSEEPSLAILPGRYVPKIEKRDLSGASVRYSDKPTLISFFFTECAPCIKEIPKINALARANPDIQFVSLTFDEKSLVEEFVSKYRLQTRVVAGEQKFIDSMGVEIYPVYALIGKDGRLLGTQPGVTLLHSSGETLFEEWLKSKLRE